ncbi:hypothetical protein A1Q2_01987 [Trichosporon asahii var. asahii CBS 8904]|uniref:Short-chain dehydrogenase/reductase SDR n=1 Tax=Trichosporon asahii var. asahii (strain CBS 8904) TaxID=1220162 RepID=K1VT84_TRIAC|nr:hypothetical protein A1Q2_01987 [Trichosporon asahii var. asahii CBS 8904]
MFSTTSIVEPENPTSKAVIHRGAVAVITGAASGIGLAAAKHLARHGLNVVMVDVAQSLDASAKEVKQVEGSGDVVPVHCDVSNIEDVVKLREQVLDTYGECQVLMNNAGISRPTPAFSLDRDLKDLQSDWAAVLGVNMNGIINVAQAFAPFMSRQENESVIINTGSKQGVTCPPGKAGYNVSKAAVKVFTEQPRLTLSPGWVFTGLSGANDGKPKPPGAWTPEQTIEYMFEKVLEEGDFYVICPDNETTPSAAAPTRTNADFQALDKARIQWALGDIIENRPALSRWHPSYAARYEDFIESRQGLAARSRSRGRAPLDRIPDVPGEREQYRFQQ